MKSSSEPSDADLAAAEEWVRDFSLRGETYRRDQLEHRWNGPDGRKHRETLQVCRPMLLAAAVKHVKALVAALPTT